MSNQRKHRTAEEKTAILRRRLIDKVPLSTLCDEHQLHPTVFYCWLKQFFENGAAAFGPAPRAALRPIPLARPVAEFHSAPTGRRMTLECPSVDGLDTAFGAQFVARQVGDGWASVRFTTETQRTQRQISP